MEATYIAATADEAIAKGLSELGMTREQVDIQVLDSGSKGIFGIGSRQARVCLTVKEDALRAQMQKEEEAKAEALAAEKAVKAAQEKQEQKPEKKPEMPVKREQPKAEKSAKPVKKEQPRTEKPAKPVKREQPRTEKPAKPVKKEQPVPAEIEEDKQSVDVLNEETMQIAANVVRDLMEKMHVNAEITSKIKEAADDTDSKAILIDIRGDDLSYLIGRHSEVLHSLQYITSLIVGREVGHWVPLVIDVQGYRERRERQLRQMASRMADQVAKTGRRISLEPMPATERRIIHLALRENEFVMTESIGEEPNRKVVIYPKDAK